MKKIYQLLILTTLLSSCSVKRGHGADAFFSLFFVFFIVIGTVLAYVVKEEIRLYRVQDQKGRKHFIKRYYGFFAFFIILIGSIQIVKLIPEPVPISAQEFIDYGYNRGDEELENKGHRLLYMENISDPKVIYESMTYMNNHFADFNHLMHDTYDRGAKNTDASDMELFRAAVVKVAWGKYREGFDLLEQMTSDTMSVVNYLKGRYYYARGNGLKASEYFEKELAVANPYYEECFDLLGMTYQNLEEYDKMAIVANHPKALEFMNSSLMIEAFYRTGQLLNLSYVSIARVTVHFKPFILIGALAVMLVWLYYLFSVNPFEGKKNVIQTFSLIAMSSISLLLLFPIFHGFFGYTLGFTDSNDSFFQSLIYYTFTVGVVEELVKILPVALILFIDKKEWTPYKFVFYASVSALTFGTLENVLYFSWYGIDLIQARGLTSVVCHMMFSSIVAYQFGRAHYLKEGNPWLKGLLGLGIASLAHGLFDVFLGEPVSLPFLSFLIFMFLVHIWSSMINYTINFSPYYDSELIKSKRSLKSILMCALLLIYVTEYFLLGLEQGPFVANDRLAASFFESGYLLLFLGITIGKIDFFKGYWGKLSLPSSVEDVLLPKEIEELRIIGFRIRLFGDRNSPIFNKLLPNTAQVIARRVYNRSTKYYLIELDNHVAIKKNLSSRYMVVKIKNYDAVVNMEHKTPVVVYFIKEATTFSSIKLESGSLVHIGHGAITQTTY